MILADKRFDAMAFAVALSLQLAPSMPTVSVAPIDAGVAWHHYGKVVGIGLATGSRILDAVRSIR